MPLYWRTTSSNEGFGSAVPVDEAKGPILDQMAAGEPFVGPGEDKGSRDAGLEGGVHLPGQHLALPLLPLAEGIDAEFGQDQRLVDRDVVQPRDISAERGLVVQIDVEADEIGEVDGQILGRRVIGVADQRVGMLGLDAGDKALEKAAHGLGAVPANHIGGISLPIR